MNWPMLLLLALAASRVVHLVADDYIPFGPLRFKLEKSKDPLWHEIGEGMSCTFCCSVWAGLFAALLATAMDWVPSPGGWEGVGLGLVIWWAFAQAIVLCEGLVEYLMSGGSD